MKRGRPINSKDITPRNRITQMRIDTPEEVHDKQKALVKAYDKRKAFEEVYSEQEAPTEAYIEQETFEEVRDKETTDEEAQVLENYEISINYVHNREK